MWRNVLLLAAVAALTAGCDEEPAAESGSDAGTGSDDGGTGGVTAGIPCAVERVLSTQCRSCHAATPINGSLSSLMTYEDFHRDAKTNSAKKIYELARESVEANVMPPTDVRLNDADKAALLAWLEEGAPSVVEPCSVGPGGGDGGVVTPELPCTPDHRILAHADGDPSAGYPVPKTGNEYTCFAYKAPFVDGEQAIAWAPITDDARVLHHWIIFETKVPQEEGRAFPCNALPTSDARFLFGWAPGGESYVMPEDVGLKLDSDSWLLLQVHYWNFDYDTTDRSGIAICTTKTPRTHEAGVVGVGTTSISVPPGEEATATGTCPSTVINAAVTANGGEPIRVLGSSPHMHRAGIRFRSEVLRGGGGSETITDVNPFRFDDQRVYPLDPPLELRAGDSIRVHCTYRNETNETIRYGENTEEEMCFDYLLVTPVLPPPYPGFAPSYCLSR